MIIIEIIIKNYEKKKKKKKLRVTGGFITISSVLFVHVLIWKLIRKVF